MQWEKSKSNPPIWWQLHLANGLIEISVQYRFGNYCASVGRGLSSRQEVFSTLSEAQEWGIREARKSLKQALRDLKSTRYYLIETCFVLAIALHIIYLIGGFIEY